MDDVEFRVLGPFEVRRGDELLADGGGKRRAVLAVLLLSANRAVSPARLVEQIWGDDPPASAANLVQGYVSDWRRLLDPRRAPRTSGERLVSTGAGYLLRVGPHESDLLRFSRLAQHGRRAAGAGDLNDARRQLRSATSERRGKILADFGGTPLDAAATGLEAEWLAVVELAAEVELRLGSPEAALEYVESAIEDNPLRETLAALRMRSLYQLGRQAEALAAYDVVRAALSADLGVDPSPLLRQLHLDILRQSPTLDRPTEAPRHPSTLPNPLSSFVGRTRELAQVVTLLSTHRLVTLTGPGGSGKTRLAVEAAARIAAEDRQTVTFVDLSPVRDRDLMWQAVATALGRPVPATPVTNAALAQLLPPGLALLVLDNLEQLSGAAGEVARLFGIAPGARVLATSRQALGLPGEQQMSVPPLPTPASGHDRHDDAVLESPAVRLFLDRVASCDPTFEVAEIDVPVLAGIVRRLDGLPLTLELAAPWVTTLSLRALLERLDRPLTLLADTAPADRPERHRSLRAALEWSYAALTPDQRHLLERMSVFVSGARLDAIEAVSDLGEATLMRTAELVARNLVSRTGPADMPRYRLLETIREYAIEQLHSHPTVQLTVRERHAAHFSALAEGVARAARTRSGEESTVRLDEEQDEIRTAIDHLIDTGTREQLLALLVDCLPLWWDLGHVREGHGRLIEALRTVNGLPDDLCASAHLAAAVLAEALGQPESALDMARHGGTLAQKADSLPLEASSRCLEGNLVSWMDWSGDAARGIAILETARHLGELIPRGPVRWGWTSRVAVVATAAVSLVDVLRYRDNMRAQQVLASVTVGSAGETGRHTESFILRAAGALAADAGQYSTAELLLHDSLAAARSVPSRRSESRSHEELSRLAWARGDLADAASRADAAVAMSKEAGHSINLARCAALRADVAIEVQDYEHAKVLLDDADTAVGTGNPAMARTLVQPRRARLSRLKGSHVLAEHQLAATAALEQAAGLTPDRVVYLIEVAALEMERGHSTRAAYLADLLVDEARRVGITLPLPERARLGTLQG